MAKFIVRVELHKRTDLTHPDYTTLHDAMKREGFSRQIESYNHVWYHLPPAEYVIESQLALNAILNKAKSAANSVDSSNGVIATQSDAVGSMWDGLKLV